jgi:hypothetical protein
MLPFLKKSDAAPVVQPFWHPEFRNREKLPDIKAVRTTFWVNGPAIFLVLAFGMYFCIQQWQLAALRQQVADADARIARDKKPSDQAKALYAKFQAEEARINEIQGFITSKPLVSTLILRIGATMPKDIAVDALDFRDAGLSMRISVRGEAAAASGQATAYLEQLKADKELSAFEEFTFVNAPVRNPSTGNLSVEFMLRLKGVKK